MVKFYVVFNPLPNKGIYERWDECSKVVKGKPYASFCSFKSLKDAQSALQSGSLRAWKLKKEHEDQLVYLEHVHMPCLVVDAACSGFPGPVEYRGLVLPDRTIAFSSSVYKDGSNNIGEFLAIVTGLRWLENTSLPYKLYSDSAVAIKWVCQLGECKTTLKNIGPELEVLIKSAVIWLNKQSSTRYIERVHKWDTANWGEIPADFNRK